MVSRRSSGEPLQGILKFVLVVLAASLLDAGRVMAQEELHLMEGVATHVLKVVSKAPKLPPELRQRAKGGIWGIKTKKYGKKAWGYMTPPAPGSTTVLVDRIAIQRAGSLATATVPVVWADITSQATAEIEGDSCTFQTPVPIRATSISLLGTGGTGRLGPLFGATYYRACPVPVSRAIAVLGLGRGGVLASRFSTFSYLVVRGEDLYSNTQVQVCFGPQPQRSPARPIITLSSDPRFPNLYYVPFTGIHIGARPGLPLALQPGTGGMYLSTEPFTYLEKNLYIHLKSVLRSLIIINPVTPPAPQRGDQLCYSAGTVNWRSLPTIAIVFSNSAAMEVDWDNLWYKDGPTYDCLAILPSPNPVSVLGGFLQSGRMMTISRQLGGSTTLTF